jgi:hypothetical protein
MDEEIKIKLLYEAAEQIVNYAQTMGADEMSTIFVKECLQRLLRDLEEAEAAPAA